MTLLIQSSVLTYSSSASGTWCSKGLLSSDEVHRWVLERNSPDLRLFSLCWSWWSSVLASYRLANQIFPHLSYLILFSCHQFLAHQNFSIIVSTNHLQVQQFFLFYVVLELKFISLFLRLQISRVCYMDSFAVDSLIILVTLYLDWLTIPIVHTTQHFWNSDEVLWI